jgi:hypothetical protein
MQTTKVVSLRPSPDGARLQIKEYEREAYTRFLADQKARDEAIGAPTGTDSKSMKAFYAHCDRVEQQLGPAPTCEPIKVWQCGKGDFGKMVRLQSHFDQNFERLTQERVKELTA